MPRQDGLVIYFKNLTIKKDTVVTTTFNVTDPFSTVVFKMEPGKKVSFKILLAYERTPNATDFDHSLLLNETSRMRLCCTTKSFNIR